MSWTPELRQQYDSIRNQLHSNYINNINVIKVRSVPAALDYPGAAAEVEQSKQTIKNITGRIAQESDTLSTYLKAINANQGTELANEISETEQKLRRLETENRKYESQAELRKGQAAAVYNKYERNDHSQNYMYAPWETSSSSWFSYSPIGSYINLNPAARSGILFIALFFGFAAILVLGTRAVLSYYYSAGSSRPLFKPFDTTVKGVKPGLIRRF